MLKCAGPPWRAGQFAFHEDPNVRAGDGQQMLMNASLRTAKVDVQALVPGCRCLQRLCRATGVGS